MAVRQLERFTLGYHWRQQKRKLLRRFSPLHRLSLSTEQRQLSNLIEDALDNAPRVKVGDESVEAYWIADAWERPDAWVFAVETHEKAKVSGSPLKEIGDRVRHVLAMNDIDFMVDVLPAPPRIEVYKREPDSVPMAQYLQMLTAQPANELLCVPGVEHKVRKTVPVGFKLNDPRNAHIGAAATSGGGKTFMSRAGLMSLAINNDPATLRMVIIDPGLLDMKATNMRFLPHLACPIISDAEQAVYAVKQVVSLMYQRKGEIDTAIEAGAVWVKPSTVLLFIDEIAGLLAFETAIMESMITIAQEGRKYGIHLWWATQRCTVDVINGHLRSNTPMMIAGKVRDTGESEIATGRGGMQCHMLTSSQFKVIRDIEPRTMQAFWLTTDEVNQLVPQIQKRWQHVPAGWTFTLPGASGQMLKAAKAPAQAGRPTANDEPLARLVVDLWRNGQSVTTSYVRNGLTGKSINKDRADRILELAQSLAEDEGVAPVQNLVQKLV